MKKRFLVPIITPFNEDESVNYDALAKLTRAVLDSGADGIYASGSSAECFLLSEEERKKTLETVIKAADGAFVMAHVGNIGNKITVELAEHAKQAGANAIASVPPFYFAYPFEGIKSYYADMAKVGLPVTVYSLPARTRNFTTEEYKELMSINGIDGIKFTDTNYFAMQQIIAHTGKFVYSGCDECFISALAQGANGAIGTTFNYMMENYIEIYDLFHKGENEKALEIQQRSNAVTAACLNNGGLPAFKYLTTLRHGIDCGSSRKPFMPLTDEQKKYLEKVAIEYGVLK